MGGHQRADPTGRGRQNKSSAMGDRSVLNERGAKAPRKEATSEAPLMEEGGGQCGVWPNRMYFSFDLGASSFFFSCLAA